MVFEIDELLAGEDQYVEILVAGKSVRSIDVWSESEGSIENVSILDVVSRARRGLRRVNVVLGVRCEFLSSNPEA